MEEIIADWEKMRNEELHDSGRQLRQDPIINKILPPPAPLFDGLFFCSSVYGGLVSVSYESP
jgi:hypothetical protein